MMSPALGNPNGNTLQEFHYQSRGRLRPRIRGISVIRMSGMRALLQLLLRSHRCSADALQPTAAMQLAQGPRTLESHLPQVASI